MLTRHLEVIFCDDIRPEVGNKFSLMGLYFGDLQVSELPAVLPKLCLRITLVTPSAQPFQKAVIRVCLDETVLVEMPNLTSNPEYQANVIAADEASASENIDPKNRAATFVTMVTLSPFTINGEGVLRVKVETEDGELRAPALKLKLIPSAV